MKLLSLYGHLDSNDRPNTAGEERTHNKNTVTIYEEDSIVGHVPFTLPLSIFARYVNKAFAEVTGAKENRGAGCGLEIPCVYLVYGPKAYVIKLKELTDSLKAAGHIYNNL